MGGFCKGLPPLEGSVTNEGTPHSSNATWSTTSSSNSASGLTLHCRIKILDSLNLGIQVTADSSDSGSFGHFAG